MRFFGGDPNSTLIGGALRPTGASDTAGGPQERA